MNKELSTIKNEPSMNEMALQVNSGESQAIAVAEGKKAEIQAAYIMAMKMPRSEAVVRTKILEVCKNSFFSKSAIYSKPVGGRKIEGLSIRFAEEALRLWGNIFIDKSVIYDDHQKKIIRVTAIDLETNTKYGEDITIEKTIERKNSNGYEVISERLNKKSERVFIVIATDDDLKNKENSNVSKSIRNLVLRLIPSYIREEAVQTIKKAQIGAIKDPKELIKKLCDSFASLRIPLATLEKYLGHNIDDCNNEEIVELNNMYQTIRDGEAKMADYFENKTEPKRQPEQADLSKMTAGEAGHTPVGEKIANQKPSNWDDVDKQESGEL